MNMHRRLVQFAEYMVGGASYFWSGYLVFALFYSGLGWDWLPAKMVSDVVGWTLNYLIQRYWAFASPQLRKHEGATVGKYSLLTAINFALDYVLIWSLKRVGISPYIGFVISAGFFTVWNYLWYRLWVFYVKRSGNAKEGAI
jgi:putative flippase GtrA